MKLRVGVAARCLNTPHIRGMGRYVYELLRQSAAAAPGLHWRLYGDDPRHPMLSPPGACAEADVFSFRGDRFQAWEQIGLPLRARGDHVDLLHCTEGALPWWQPVPTVVTLHDTLAWEEHGTSAAERIYLNTVQPRALAACAAVITISRASERDIVAKWPRLAPKVSVIPHGIGDEYFEDGPAGAAAASAELGAAVGADRYIVYLGGPLPRKRLDWALQVLGDCADRRLHLVVCGFGAAARDAARSKLAQPLGELGPRVQFAPFLDDGALVALYRGACALLYPTLYEGFGFPAVEAQAAGVPALFSAVSSLAELVGPLAFVVEPHDRAGWSAALARALALGAGERQALAAQSRQWARAFSWKNSFEAHLKVYERAAAGAAGQRLQ